MKAPIETIAAWLPSAGYNYLKWTKHAYSHSELVTLPASTHGAVTTGLGHMFKCSETGELRRWGFDVTFSKDTGGN